MTKDTLLYRHINPAWIQDEHVSSQAFRPTAKDNKRLSVYDGDQIDLPTSWNHFTNILGLQSVGIMALSVRECSDKQLLVRADPIPFKEHAIIDFQGLAKKQIIKKSKQLKSNAIIRGWLAVKSDFD